MVIAFGRTNAQIICLRIRPQLLCFAVARIFTAASAPGRCGRASAEFSITLLLVIPAGGKGRHGEYFSSGQGAKAQECFLHCEPLQRRTGEKGPPPGHMALVSGRDLRDLLSRSAYLSQGGEPLCGNIILPQRGILDSTTTPRKGRV